MVFRTILMYHISSQQTDKNTRWRCNAMAKKTLFLCIFTALFTVIALKTAGLMFSPKDNGLVAVFSIVDTDGDISDRKHC